MIAEDEAVAMERRNRPAGNELNQSGLARQQCRPVEHRRERIQARRADMERCHRPMLEWLALAARNMEADIDPIRGHIQDRVQQPLSTLDRLFLESRPRQVDCASFSSAGARHGPAVHMKAADPSFDPGRRNCEGVARRNRAGHHGSGHDPAHPVHSEASVNRHPEKSSVRPWQYNLRIADKPCLEFVDTGPGPSGNREQVSSRKSTGGQKFTYLFNHCSDPTRRYQIDLADGHDPAADAQEVKYHEMLMRLRHRPIIGGDDQERVVEPGRAGDHIVDKTFVSGYIHETDRLAGLGAQMGKAEIDRDAPPLLLRQPVGIDPGEGAHQRGLPMIDVSGSPDDHRLSWRSGSWARNAASSSRQRRSSRRRPS